MAHDQQQSMVARNDFCVEPEVMGQGMMAHGLMEPPTNMTVTTSTQKRPLPQPPTVKEAKKPRSKPHYICSELNCNEKFSCLETLKTHMKLHQEIKPFTCSFCGKVCQTESRLNAHQARHASDGEQRKCDICDRNFSSRSALNKHKKRIHKPLPHVCPHCQSGFEKHIYMVIHAKRAHAKDLLPELSDHDHGELHINFEPNDYYAQRDVDEEKDFSKGMYCNSVDGNQLGQSTSTTTPSYDCQKEHDRLKNNVLDNLQRKVEPMCPPITCEMCTSTFPSVAYLDQHMEVHLSEKSFNCRHCDMKFTKHQHFSNHLKNHSLENEPLASFPSTFNNGSFTHYVTLPAQPTATRGPQIVGRYVCALCNEQFLNLGSLKRHQAKGHISLDLNM